MTKKQNAGWWWPGVALLMIGFAAAGCTVARGPVVPPTPISAVPRETDAVPWIMVTGKVVQTSDYCGGANPSEEMLDFLRKEKPFPNKELLVRSGSQNTLAKPVLKSFTSDAEGNFSLLLPPGDYCVIETSKKDALKIPNFTEENKKIAASRGPSEPYQLTSVKCLEQWWSSCDAKIKIEREKLDGVIIKFHHTCRPPCVTGGPVVM